MPGLAELKAALIAQGFEVYRTLSDRIVLADRVRDNLIMDSGVAAGRSSKLFVCFVVRAQANDFPAESHEQLLDRARLLAADATGRGYQEVGTAVVPIEDPGDRARTLDVWHEVQFQRFVGDENELFNELRYVLALEKTAQGVRG
jgi:hypothetical protein